MHTWCVLWYEGRSSVLVATSLLQSWSCTVRSWMMSSATSTHDVVVVVVATVVSSARYIVLHAIPAFCCTSWWIWCVMSVRCRATIHAWCWCCCPSCCTVLRFRCPVLYVLVWCVIALSYDVHVQLFFVLDYCAGGELFFHLDNGGQFPEPRAKVNLEICVWNKPQFQDQKSILLRSTLCTFIVNLILFGFKRTNTLIALHVMCFLPDVAHCIVC